MRIRRRVVFAALFVFAIGCFAWFVLREPPEPVYKGKPLSKWLEGYDTDMPFSMKIQKERDANEAVKAIGTNAVPFLLSMLDVRDSSIKSKLSGILKHQSIVDAHYALPETKRNRVASAFAVLGPDARFAFPQLAGMLRKAKGPERFEIGECIARILAAPSTELQRLGFDDDSSVTPNSNQLFKVSRSDVMNELGPCERDDGTFATFGISTNMDASGKEISNWALIIFFEKTYAVNSSFFIRVP